MQQKTLVKKKMKSSEKFGETSPELHKSGTPLDIYRLWNKIGLSLQLSPPRRVNRVSSSRVGVFEKGEGGL